MERLACGAGEILRHQNNQFEFWRSPKGNMDKATLVRTVSEHEVLFVRLRSEKSLRPWLAVVLALFAWTCVFAQADAPLPAVKAQPVRAEAISSLDTIFVTTSSTLLMVFPDPVKKMDLGTKDFGGSPDGNTVMLKAIKNTAIPTSLIVLYGDNEFYHGTIAYDDSRYRKLPIIRLKKEEAPKTDLINEQRAITDKSESLERQAVSRRLGFIEAADDRFADIAQVTDKLGLSLREIMADERRYYLKLMLVNRSKQDYMLESVFFTYITPRANSREMDKTPMNPDDGNDVSVIATKDHKYLVYALPRYTLSTEGSLQIEAHEKNGARIVPLEVKFSVLQKAKIF